MPLVLLNRRRRGFTAFSPSTLFALAEPGVWFDPSDLTTLFQDTAGTTPVTAPGNTVGLMLDKSKGLALGPEVVVNGNFATDTDWIKGTGWTISGGAAIHSGTVTGNLQQNVLTAGRTYKITMNVSGGTVLVLAGGGAFTGAVTGSVSAILTATGPQIFIQAATDGVTVDNVSYRELPGNHATQATLAARPTYSIEPVGGRRNLLLQTEAFNEAVWTKSNGSFTSTTETSPIGTATADVFTQSSGVTSAALFYINNTYPSTPASTALAFSIYAKRGAKDFLVVGTDVTASAGSNSYSYFNLSNGTVGTAASGHTLSIASVGSGWYRCTLSATSRASVQNTTYYVGHADTNGSLTVVGSGSTSFWGAQIELGSTATAYQRVTTQYDVTEAGVASVSYLYFDGGGDFMSTGTITPGTDKAQVFAGVRKLNGNTSVIAELSDSIFSNSGSLLLYSDGSSLRFASRGTATLVDILGAASAPSTKIVTGLGDISGDTATLRFDGVQVATSTTDQGTGNYLAYPLYLGRRGGTSFPFEGHIYSLITRFGPTLDAPTIASTETWVAGKTGIVI